MVGYGDGGGRVWDIHFVLVLLLSVVGMEFDTATYFYHIMKMSKVSSFSCTVLLW